ncbi:MAG: dTDP-4-dehydrorhamnose 3,5-epimerase [Chitinophagaceae bacterium]|nr:dTDP-4-dehydrorhamnose 3,5-epimerase [Chitinophagaceae bacterium]
MPFVETDIPGLLVFEPKVFADSRGYFFESYNERNFKEHGLNVRFVQDNESSSSYGVIRGLHYQLPPHTQTKLVRVLDGGIQDVVVDMREGSPTFGKTFSVELTSANKKQLFIPRGFAHGFSVLSEQAVVLYKCDEFYNQPSENGIRFDDPRLGIDWRIPTNNAIISDKDKMLPLFNEVKHCFVYE